MKQAHPHLELARSLWSAAAEGDAPAVRSVLNDAVVWRSTGLSRLSGEYRGPDGVLEYLVEVGEAVDELTSRIDDVFVSDDGAVIAYHVSARRGSKSLEMDYLLRLRIRGGRIVEGLVVPVDQRENDDFWP